MIHTTSPAAYYVWRVLFWSAVSLVGWGSGFATIGHDLLMGVALCGAGFIAMWITFHFVTLWRASGRHD